MTVNRLTLRHCGRLSNKGIVLDITVYGYIRTSRQRIVGTAGSDPEAQAYQLRQADVPDANIYRDVGVSGGIGTNSRAGWRALDSHLQAEDTLVVVALDRIGRRWLDTLSATRDLRKRGVSIRSLADTEWSCIKYLESAPDSPESFIADRLISLISYPESTEGLGFRPPLNRRQQSSPTPAPIIPGRRTLVGGLRLQVPPPRPRPHHATATR